MPISDYDKRLTQNTASAAVYNIDALEILDSTYTIKAFIVYYDVIGNHQCNVISGLRTKCLGI